MELTETSIFNAGRTAQMYIFLLGRSPLCSCRHVKEQLLLLLPATTFYNLCAQMHVLKEPSCCCSTPPTHSLRSSTGCTDAAHLINFPLHNKLHFTARQMPGWTISVGLLARKLTEASFASDRLPSSSVDSLSSSSRSSEALVASVTTELLMGSSVSFQTSAEHVQNTPAGKAATKLK